jgi:inorganic pyrophosphatase
MKEITMKRILAIACAFLLAGAAGLSSQAQIEPLAAGLSYKDATTIQAPVDFVRAYEAVNADGSANAVIEIPAGSIQKWEVSAKTGVLAWEIKNGKPRLIDYSAYPANYGMIAKTLANDGDTLDVLVLGPMIPRGTVVKARVIGIMKFDDSGKRDDKLIAVVDNTNFASITDIAELDAKYPGVTEILDTWFYNYKGPGQMIFKGFGDAAQGKASLAEAAKSFK